MKKLVLEHTASPLQLIDSAVAAHAHPHAHEAAE